jgi:hypothetical protein
MHTDAPLTLSWPWIGHKPKAFFPFTQVSQLEFPPPEFCHTEMAVPTRNPVSFSLAADLVTGMLKKRLKD